MDMSKPEESTNPARDSANAQHQPRRSMLEFIFEPSHREVAIQFFFVSLLLLLVGGWLCVADYRTALESNSEYGTARGFSFLMSFGIFGIVFGAFGNLLVPLQTGAGRSPMRFSARFTFLLYAAAAICFLAAISFADPTSAQAVRWFRTSAACLCFCMVMMGGQFFSLAVLGRCRGMTFSRFPMAARAFAYLGIPLALVAVFTGLGAWFFDAPEGTQAWESWFHLGPDHSFWAALTFGVGGISVFVVGSMLFDILAGLGRKPLGSRFLAAFAGILGGYAVVAKTFVFPATSSVADLVSASSMLFIFLCAAILSVTLILSLLPRKFKPHPGLYFVWSVPILFLGAMTQSAENLPTLFLVALMPAIFAATYYWYPRLFRRNLNQAVGRIHFWLSLTAVLLILTTGWWSYENPRELQAVGLLMLLTAQFPYIINVVASSWKYGNRIFIYAAVIFVIEIISRWLPFLHQGIWGWLWGNGITEQWLNSTLLSAAGLIIITIIDWQLLRAFPSKRQHPRPNRWVALATMMVSFPLVIGPLIFSGQVIEIGNLGAWLVTLASAILGLMYAFKRGNRLTFGDEVVDNPWRAQSLEWYERTPADLEAGLDSFDPTTIEVFRGAYEFAEPGADDDFMPQWLADPATAHSTN